MSKPTDMSELAQLRSRLEAFENAARLIIDRLERIEDGPRVMRYNEDFHDHREAFRTSCNELFELLCMNKQEVSK